MADPTATPAARKIPSPQPNPETKLFWEAAAGGRLLIGRCNACGRPHYFPRSLCPFCFGETTTEAASGEGEIYTVSVTYRGTPEPFAIGYVTLTEGPRVLTNFVNCDLAGLRIGQKVRLCWTPSENGAAVPTFTPV